MQKLRITLAFLLLTSLGAVAQSSNAAQTTAPGAATAPQAQTNSPGSTMQAPRQSQPQGQTMQGQSQPKTVDEELQLTPDQKQKIAAVIDDENKQMGAVRDDTSLAPEQKQAKAVQIRQDGANKIKAVLSPEQLQKLAALQEKARQQQGAPSSSPQ